MNPVTEKLKAWVQALDAELLERQQAVRLAALALTSGQHLLLLGEPGTAKTLLAQRVAGMIAEKPFVTLLTKFSTPEDVFGPLSLKRLEEGVYERLVTDYLPAARVAFVDEIYKANASILNAMLSILNERRFYNGSTVLDVPLLSLLAASNELPDDDEALDALDDRLLLRIRVDSLREAGHFAALLQRRAAPAGIAPLALDELKQLKGEASRVRLGDEFMPAMLNLREACRASSLRVSDRRWRQCVDVMAACAAIDGDQAIQPAHLGVLRFALWRKPGDQPKVVDALANAIKVLPITSVTATGKELIDQLTERLVAQDALLARFEKARGYYYGEKETSQLKPEVLEAGKKAENVVTAAKEFMERLSSALSGRSGLWRPFWSDVLPQIDLDKKIDAVRNHKLWSEEVQRQLGPATAPS